MLSIILPVYNEVDNLRPLRDSIVETLELIDQPYELIFVNDGSTDGSADALDALAHECAQTKVIHLRRNFGQTAAMMAGIDHAQGDILIPMDADQQNDPADIPRLVSKLDEGFDVVSGWRKDRQDAMLSRKIPSVIANRLISWMSGVHLNDYGCTMKAYRREVLENVHLYGEMHRFIPIYSSWQGGRICELAVNHRARVHGESKYGLNRVFKVALDLLVVRFLGKYDTKPIYVFGAFALMLLALAFGAGIWAVILKYVYGTSFILTPLPLLAVMCFITSAMTMLMGLLAELLVRVYYESQDKSVYMVRRTANLEV